MPDLPAGVAFVRRAAYLRAADALVLADVHLGRDRESGVELPLGEREDVLDRLTAALDRFAPAEVVVAGDLLHSFGRLPEGVADAVDAFEAAVADAGADLAVTPGNHDAMLAEVLTAPAPAEYRLADGTVVCHGHECPAEPADRYLLGHDHPAITIEGRKHPCFLYGEGAFRGADVLVLPAFSRLARGVAVEGAVDGGLLSPMLASGVGEYRPVVYDDDADEALTFPPLEKLRRHL